jgi:hypothetical protein
LLGELSVRTQGEVFLVHKYVADEETRVYHINLPLKDECELATDIDIREQAEKAGYSPCELCVLKTSRVTR